GGRVRGGPGGPPPPAPTPRPRRAARRARVGAPPARPPPVGFDVGADEFIIGATAASDLRLPGSNLPAQVCAIQRTADGARLRKIAPALPILLNGTPIAPLGQADLRHGDVVSVGPVDLHISIGFSLARPVPVLLAPEAIRVADPSARLDEWERQRHDLEARAKAIEEQARELEADRVLWYERRQEIEREIHAAREGLDSGRREQDHSTTIAELRSKVEQEVNEEYRSRREELERLQLAVREAAVQLRERKQKFEDGFKNVDPRLKELDRREKEIAVREKATESALADLTRRHDTFEAERQTQEHRHQQREQDMARREVELAARELAAREL